MGAPEAQSAKEQRSVLIQGGLLLDARGGSRQADLRIEHGRIAAIEERLEHQDGEDVIDARDKLVAPGLVNAHLHSAEALLRGRYENLPLEIWGMYAYPLLSTPELSRELIYLRTMLVALESLKNGVTTVVDDGPETSMLDLEALEAVFGAYGDSGIRANCSGAVINRHMVDALPYADEVPAALRSAFHEVELPTAEGYVEFSEEAIRRYHGAEGDRLRYFVSPIAPQWCTDEMLIAAAELAERRHINLNTHVLESRTQLETSKQIYRKSLVRYLSDLGVLNERTTIAHSIWISEEDLELIAAAGASVVHNPISNQKLGAGIAPLRALLDGGINVGLGTDGIASNDSARLFDVVRAAALIHNPPMPRYTQWPSASEVWHAATIGGAQSALLGGEVGVVETGAKADLVLFDLKSLPFTPRNDLIKHLVYCENGSSISMVFVDGRLIVEGGKVLTVNEADIIDAVNKHHPAFVGQQEVAERLQQQFESQLGDRSTLGPSRGNAASALIWPYVFRSTAAASRSDLVRRGFQRGAGTQLRSSFVYGC